MQFNDIAVYCENSTKQANRLHAQSLCLSRWYMWLSLDFKWLHL